MISFGKLFFIIGAVLLIWGIIINKKYSPSAKADAEIDSFCDQLAKRFFEEKRNVMLSSGINTAKEYRSQGYSFDNIISDRKTQAGKDGVLRSSAYRYSISFFADRSIFYFGRIQSVISPENYENQKEINLDDVLTFSVETLNNAYAVSFNMKNGENMFIMCDNATDAQIFYNDVRKIKNA